ncbi:putative nuclease HARBI1 [Trichonephila clavipes]|nr:putative nuclease HARBI1 [Trichonephila clavipes]
MVDHFDYFLLEDLETLRSIERRSVFIPKHRNNDLDELDKDDFRRRYIFYKGTIETLVKLLRTKLDSVTGRYHAVTAAEKVLAAVRFFAFGNRQINVGDLHRISQPSTSRAIADVARALAELRPQYIYLPQTEDERMQFLLFVSVSSSLVTSLCITSHISQKFYTEFGSPGIYGALDCSLIKILNPGGSLAETFRYRKGFFALNVSDPNLSIRYIVVRWPGSTHDSTVFDHSYLRAHVETEIPSSYHLLGDSGYPPRSFLMTSFLNPVGAARTVQRELHASNLYGRVGISKPLATARMLYSDASGVEHTDSEPHNSSNKSSGRMNRRSPYSKPPDAFICG